ncbi:MAG: YicC family protein [Oscillospiraceae bacterium]|nr:YicC family protein [Oscillospiraceae bacterium]
MVRSMTGYGRAETADEAYGVTVELKSVNHRYFEFSARVPRGYGFLEEKLKTYLQGLISRGKVECFLQLETLAEADAEVTLNEPLLRGYLRAFDDIRQKYGPAYGIAYNPSLTSLLRLPDLFAVHKPATDEAAIWAAVQPVAQAAAERFVSMRETEGTRLEADILARADEILEHVAFVEERSPQTVRDYNDKLLTRMREILGTASVDEQRLLTEAALFADKIAVAEETVRLRSHLDQLRQFFRSAEAVGRKMDFLVQEINREANTIGSKAQDVEVAGHVVEIKSLVEKIREQVQNIE